MHISRDENPSALNVYSSYFTFLIFIFTADSGINPAVPPTVSTLVTLY